MSTTAAGINRAFLTRPGAAAIDPLTDDLGTLDGHTFSLANGMNDAGDVVGRSWGTVDGLIEELPFLYTGGEMYDLNALLPAESSWRLIEAYDINNAGQIVGYGTNSIGESHAFLLTIAVPEPGTFALVALGGCLMLRRHRAKK
jgi:probable HAF family extracellular repeat protein